MDINKLSFPAVILDENFKIKQKNGFRCGLRTNACIKHYVSKFDFERIKMLRPGQECRIDVCGPNIISSFAANLDGTVIVGLYPVTVELQRRIQELTGIEMRLSEIINSSTDERAIRHAVKLQDRLNEFLNIVNGTKSDTTVLYDLSGSPMLHIAPKLLSAHGAKVRVFAPDDVLPVNINVADFNRIVAIVLNDAFMFGESGIIEIRVSVYGKNIYFCVNTDGDADLIKDFSATSFSGEDGERMFSLQLAKLMCDYYFWHFNIKRSGADERLIRYTLQLPMADEMPDMQFNSPSLSDAIAKEIEHELFD